jgi:Protein of unknown function (DUF1566)
MVEWIGETMRKRFIIVLLLFLCFSTCGCGKKSKLEGKAVDGKGAPIAGLKIIAKQVEPVKGYEQFEAVSDNDGVFRFSKLFPNSKYVVKPWSGKWETKAAMEVESAPENEEITLSSPLMIRFTVSRDGVIDDSKTDFEWIKGPDDDTNWWAARAWIMQAQTAGGNWRIPNMDELRTLVVKATNDRKIDPVFQNKGRYLWSSDRNPAGRYSHMSADILATKSGRKATSSLGAYKGYRALAVRNKK